MQQHDNYDDGLVHGHSWACEPPRAVMVVASTYMPPLPGKCHDCETDRDDEFVHPHNWACSA